MIEKISIEDDGPDGRYLCFEDDFGLSGDDSGQTHFSFQINDDICRQLDAALQPWRDHMAEGEAVRAQFMRHRESGRCTRWVAGEGPCARSAGHEGECAS